MRLLKSRLACQIASEHTEIVCRHHDSILILEGEDTCSSNNWLSDRRVNQRLDSRFDPFVYYSLSMLDTLRECVLGAIVRSLCDRIGTIRVICIVSLCMQSVIDQYNLTR